MNTKEIREYKNTLKLTDIQKSILIGTLLGDGHLETQDEGKTYRLKIEHQSKHDKLSSSCSIAILCVHTLQPHYRGHRCFRGPMNSCAHPEPQQ